MRYRYGAAAIFVAIVSALLLIRHEGYLGGRAPGGPLNYSFGGDGLVAKPEERVRARSASSVLGRGGPVTVQEMRPAFASPGFRLSGPAADAGHVVEATGSQKVLLSADRPGIYFLDGIEVDYKRGARRFRRTVDGLECLHVTQNAKRNGCIGTFSIPEDTKVAEVGGPSTYGGPIRSGDSPLDLAARIRAQGERSIRLTVTNLTASEVEIADLFLTPVENEAINMTTKGTEPAKITLPPNGSASVRLDLAFSGCTTKLKPYFFERINAEIDGEPRTIPLTVKLDFRAPRKCP